MQVDHFNWKDPKIIAASVMGVTAIALIMYNCAGSKPGMELKPAEETDQVLREVAMRTLLAIQAGSKPTTVAELPVIEGTIPHNTDAWGSSLSFKLEEGLKKAMTATIVSPGGDKAVGTADDLQCVAKYEFQTGTGYNIYILGSVTVTTGEAPAPK